MANGTVSLLPCPFCGGAVWFGDVQKPDGQSEWIISGYRAWCSECKTSMDEKPTKAEATSAWNLRSVPTPVKPVEWKQHTEGVWRSETLIGDYRVWTHHEADGTWFWNLSGGTITKSDKCVSADAGKAAAEADYRDRILSALLPKAIAPAVTEEMVERAASKLLEMDTIKGIMPYYRKLARAALEAAMKEA